MVRKGSSFCERGRMNFQACAWRGILLAAGKALMWVKNITDFGRFCNLSSLFQIKYYCNLYEFLKRRIHALEEKSKTDVSVGIRRPYWCSWKGHQYGVSIQSFINLGKPFFPASRNWNISQTWFLARVFVYLSFFISQILVLLYWMVCIFIFHCVTVQAENKCHKFYLSGPFGIFCFTSC